MLKKDNQIYIYVIAGLLSALIIYLAHSQYFRSRSQALQLFAEKQLLLTEQIGQNIAHFLQDQSKELKALAMISRLDRFAGKPCQEDYIRMRRQLLGTSRIYVIAPNGEIIYQNREIEKDLGAADSLILGTDWQKFNALQPDSGLLIMSDDLSNQHATILYQFSEKDKTGSRNLFLFPVNLQQAMDGIIAGKLRRHSHTFILNETGVLLYHSLHPEMVFNDINRAGPACFTCHVSFEKERQLINMHSGWSKKTEFNGEERLISNTTLTIFNQRWILAVDRPYNMIIQASRQQFWIFFLLTFTLIAVIVSGGWALLRNRSQRIDAEHQLDVYRTRAEYADLLQEAEEKYRTLVEQSPDAIVIYQNGRIVFTNAPFLKLFEIDQNTAPETFDYISLIDPVSLETLRQRVPEIIQKKINILTLPVICRTKTGKQLQLDIFISIINYQKDMAYHIVLHDLTEINQREAEARRKKYFALIGEMSTRVAHEIKNPLASIQTGVRLLETSLPADQEHRDYFQNLVNEVQRVDHIVKGLLSLAREEKLQLQQVDASDILQKIIELIQLTLDSEHVRINFPARAGNWVITADPDKLEQVLWNIILNACEAVGEEGDIHIELNRTEKNLSILVSDTGPGIAEHAADKLFQPFYSTKTQGSGLGLAISQKIVDLHGGTISISNNETKGATVRITLPGA